MIEYSSNLTLCALIDLGYFGDFGRVLVCGLLNLVVYLAINFHLTYQFQVPSE